MKVSIITISFNQAAFLPACIDSILGQDYPDLEYIVVDAGSTDGSREILRKYGSRVTRVILESDNGPGEGLNKGFRSAAGEVFGYINADDLLLPGAVRRVTEVFSCHAEIDIVCGNGYQINEAGQRERNIYSTEWNLTAYAYGACNIVQQATFFKRDIFWKAGGFNVSNRICWDGELLVAMSLVGAKFIKIPDFLGAFRIYRHSITGSGLQKSKAFQDATQQIAERILGRSPTRGDKALSALYQFIKYLKYPVATTSGLVWKIKKPLRSF